MRCDCALPCSQPIWPSTPVVVRTDTGEVALTVADLGISLEIDATSRRSPGTANCIG